MDVPQCQYQVEQSVDTKTSIDATYAFFFYDAGETRALTPVLDALKQKGVKFSVVVMGTAREEECLKNFSAERIDIKDLGVTEPIDKTWQRAKPISDESLRNLADRVHAKKIVVGCASEAQAQIAKTFSASKTYAYWDNFNYDPSKASFDTANRVQEAAQKVICPSKLIQDEFISVAAKSKRSFEDYVVGGQPILEIWEKCINYSVKNKDIVVQTLCLKNNKEKIVTFIGGYGEDFEKVNKIFDQCKWWLQKNCFQVNTQPHPKIKKDPLVPTPEAVGVSDYVVCYDSTAAYQSLFFNKIVIFIIPEGDPTSNFAIKKGFAEKVSSVDEFKKAIFNAQQNCQRDYYELIGVPRNSTETIVNILEKS